MIAGFGGGFLYAPFSSTQQIGLFTATPNVVAGVYGNWAHMAIPILTAPARQIGIVFWPVVYGATYRVQIGMGSLGNETLWQPSDGTGFYIDWGSVMLWNVPNEISFPVSIPAAKEFSVRCASNPGGAGNLIANLYLWN